MSIATDANECFGMVMANFGMPTTSQFPGLARITALDHALQEVP